MRFHNQRNDELWLTPEEFPLGFLVTVISNCRRATVNGTDGEYLKVRYKLRSGLWSMRLYRHLPSEVKQSTE